MSPYIKDREAVKQIVGPDKFIEIYVNTSLAACERRDVKGLYKKARAGEIKNMTGISAPYQAPTHPDIEVSYRWPNHPGECCRYYAIFKYKI